MRMLIIPIELRLTVKEKSLLHTLRIIQLIDDKDKGD